MATSSNQPTYKKLSSLLIILFLIIHICVATPTPTRHRKMIVETETNSIDLKHLRRKHHGIINEGLVFNSLPKGRNPTTSSPSKRHNSFVDSTHN
ncbi:hypothetical protein RND81_07G029200 [Saponaria officinalis]|uniref:Uncharacterized protein n=1 Tax=Saponaria officinalis TaxID=3572 RepID=A0AAW1JLA9_SAPOF